jgi:hypothetical protein
MVDAVVGKHHNRPIGAEPAAEQGLSHGLGKRQGHAIGEFAPIAGGITFGEEYPLGHRCGRMYQQLSDRSGIRAEWKRRGEDHRAVTATFDIDGRRREGNLGERRF